VYAPYFIRKYQCLSQRNPRPSAAQAWSQWGLHLVGAYRGQDGERLGKGSGACLERNIPSGETEQEWDGKVTCGGEALLGPPGARFSALNQPISPALNRRCANQVGYG
jgi:hypothetical protein